MEQELTNLWKTVVRLEKAGLKLQNFTVQYLSKHNLTFNQFKVLEVLYHVGDLKHWFNHKINNEHSGNITVVVKILKEMNGLQQ